MLCVVCDTTLMMPFSHTALTSCTALLFLSLCELMNSNDMRSGVDSSPFKPLTLKLTRMWHNAVCEAIRKGFD